MRTFQTELDDERGARDAAAELLQNSVSFDIASLDQPTLTYRAVWLGSPGALGGLGVCRDFDLTPRNLASTLRGRNARTAAQVRPPDIRGVPPRIELPGRRPQVVTNTVLTLAAPDPVSREWPHASPERQAEIQRAMFDSADAAVEYLRHNVRLVGVSGSERLRERRFAHGLAAAAILDVPTEREPGDYGGLRVHLVIVGAELNTGHVITPDPRFIRAAQSDVAMAAHVELRDQLKERAPAVEPVVGRDGVWVPDPLDAATREALGTYAQRVDDMATLYGEQLTDRDDAWIERRLEQLGRPLTELDVELAAESTRLWRRDAAAWNRLFAVREDLALLRGRMDGEVGEYRALGAEHIESAWHVLHDREGQIQRELVDIGRDLDAEPAAHYVEDWLNAHDRAVFESVALERELAVRKQERALQPREVARQPPPNTRQIGRGDVDHVLADLREDRIEWRLAASPDLVRPVKRDDVVVMHQLHGLRDLIGGQQADTLAKQMEPLAAWLEHQPDDFVQTRHAALGAPDEGLDRRSAREALRLHRDEKNVAQRTERLYEHLPQSGAVRRFIDETGRPRAEAIDKHYEADCQELNRNWDKLLELDAQIEALHRENRHPTDWLGDRDRLLRSLAYAHEVAIRREINVQTQVEWSVTEPPRHIVELIGDAPELDAPERPEWESLTREVEYRRHVDEAVIRGELDRTLQTSAELDRRIEELREVRGMPARFNEAAIEGPELGY